MEEVIKKIIKIENKAQKVIIGAEDEKVRKYKDLDLRIESLHTKLMDNAEKKISRIREMELAEATEYAQNMRESCVGKVKMLDQYYKDNKEQWCNELYDQVIQR